MRHLIVRLLYWLLDRIEKEPWDIAVTSYSHKKEAMGSFWRESLLPQYKYFDKED